jgi:diguanylate cyclase (GGDEF)-like protein
MKELATRDSLTGIRNKAAFTSYVQELQDGIDRSEQIDFAVGVFDCDNLKGINDRYGHEKGDEYLKAASRLICSVFKYSPVFRIGGDEFAAILRNEDFLNRIALADEFYRESDKINAAAHNEWERVHTSMGIVTFDPLIDRAVSDTLRRADKVMYENKRGGKRRT